MLSRNTLSISKGYTNLKGKEELDTLSLDVSKIGREYWLGSVD
jgi:hypothetical protein